MIVKNDAKRCDISSPKIFYCRLRGNHIRASGMEPKKSFLECRILFESQLSEFTFRNPIEMVFVKFADATRWKLTQDCLCFPC